MGSTKKIALPIENNILCPHFDKCAKLNIYEIAGNKIINETSFMPPQLEPDLLPIRLAKKGVTDIIVLEMNKKIIGVFNQNKINVFIGVPVKMPKKLVLDYLNGTLETSDNT